MVIAVTSMSHGPVGPAGAAAVVSIPSPTPTPADTTSTAEPSPTATADPTPTPRPTPAPVASLTGYQWPLPHGRITLPFGPSRLGSRLVEDKAFHDGLDIATFCGDRVVAAHAGKVLAAGRHYDSQMGWVGSLKAYTDRLDKKHLWGTLPIVVVIDDGNGYRSMYAHFHRLVVKKGQTVKAGQLLGYEGMTGRATGCHLHYGLFSPLETATFAIEPDVAKRMKLPKAQIARIDPELVLPKRGKAAPSPKPTPSPGTGPTPSGDSP